MNTCRLHLFTWGYVNSGSGKLVLSPVCPQHPAAIVHTEQSGPDDLVVTCSDSGHALNMCSRADFEDEKEEARQLLAKL